jgi:hypothetical protein
MLTRGKKRVLLASGALAVLVLALLSIATPANYSICYENEYTNTEKCTPYQIGPFIALEILKFFTTYNGAITAIATGIIAYFTWTLWLSTRKQWRLTQRTICLARAEFNATHRPHLIVRDISVVGDNIVFLLINKGDAPAVLVESWLLVESPTEGQAIRPMRSEGHNNLGNISFAVGEIREITWPLGEFTMSIKYGAGIPIKRGDMTEYDHRGAIHFAMTIVYADSERQHRRRSVFRRKWDRERKGFCRLNDPDQEYTD